MSDDAGTGSHDPLAALRSAGLPTTRERISALVLRIPSDARPWALALLLVLATGLTVVGVALVPGWISSSGRTPSVDPDAVVAGLPFAGTGSTVASSPSPPSELVVHAAGAVMAPGLYRLSGGSRVGDLLTAAGGIRPDGDLDRVNLAAPLADGERVYVPSVGELEVPPLAGPDQPSGAAAPEATGGSTGPTIDLNRAGVEQLETLPGIGPSLAAAIVEHRETSGPYRSVDELLDVRGIGESRLAQLRDLVRV
jgi:competence protein ComEA